MKRIDTSVYVYLGTDIDGWWEEVMVMTTLSFRTMFACGVVPAHPNPVASTATIVCFEPVARGPETSNGSQLVASGVPSEVT